MNSNDKKTIWQEASNTHKNTTVVLSLTSKEDVKLHKSDCRDKSLVVKSVINAIDNEMGDLRKQKRLWKELRDDLENDFSKCNDLFFDLLRDEPKRHHQP